jgi:hypothetical protein
MRALLASALLGLLLLAAAPASAQDVSAEPTFGDVRLEAGFTPDPYVVELLAGGSIEVNLDECDYGHVAEAPDVDLYYYADGTTTLYIAAASNSDTMLLVNLPDGTWICDDDSFGDLDPILVIPNAPSGLYNIWVGTLGEEMDEADLYISEIDPR